MPNIGILGSIQEILNHTTPNTERLNTGPNMIYWLIFLACTQDKQTAEQTSHEEPPVQQESPEASNIALKPAKTRLKGPKKRFVLKDGSIITGMFLGTNSEGFEIKSDSLGRISLPSDRVVSMSSIEDSSLLSSKDNTQEQVPTLNNSNINAIPVVSGENSISNIPPSQTVNVAQPQQALNAHMVQNIQNAMMQNPDIMNALYALQSDPTIMRLLQDPEIMQLIQRGDMEALRKHPTLKKLEKNPNLRYILRQFK